MADWSDWYQKEDLTTWVLPEILQKRAEEHPDRDFLKFGDAVPAPDQPLELLAPSKADNTCVM